MIASNSKEKWPCNNKILTNKKVIQKKSCGIIEGKYGKRVCLLKSQLISELPISSTGASQKEYVSSSTNILKSGLYLIGKQNA